MKQIIGMFKDYLSVVGYSIGTQSMLPRCVNEFLHYRQCDDVSLVTPTDIRLFYEWLQVRPLKRKEGTLSEMMIAHYMYALRVFFDWLQAMGVQPVNPISGLKFKTAVYNGRKPLSREEIERLFDVATTVKERVVLHLFYSCGLRRSEAVRLQVTDVHLSHQVLYVKRGKNARRRVIPLPNKVVVVLGQYLKHERSRTRKSGSAFMLNRIGHSMRGDSYLLILKKLLSKADLSKDITLHHLRHSIATHLLHGGMSLGYVRDYLGHRHLESTQIYAIPGVHQLQQL
ncbi:tyrosine-type recombinase/integrase [Chitinophaga sp. CB10]|uniref:tyrosine-type recombinase/integrase n=1 Tax=Chitinophaga sp. CB10 TaxID=1891659 RepID=UPI0025C1773D|nr:tyrosine-type recombinase/integrase [Chitinophaga sp. CB10]